MKKISAAAKEKGYTVNEIHCSSDPDSLDGLKINELNIGFTDGTAPHTRDPKYPKIRDEIIDLAECIDINKLKESQKEIVELIDEKSLLYKKLYAYLSSAEYLINSERAKNENFVNKEKMLFAIARLLEKYPEGKCFSTSKMQISAFSMKGTVKFDTYAQFSEKIYNISDKRDISHIFMAMLYEKAKERKERIIFSCRSTSPYELSDILLPDLGIAFINNTDTFDKNINLDRFYEKHEPEENLALTSRFIKSCKNTLYDSAEKIFEQIARKHFELEKIYSSAMDFSRSDAICDKLISEIL
ncbi:MAG: hypothetical protein E7623_03260 [Ruminococcaceae bacterium]|nr:hypothetical protein [Oscillospiraceae bacterium]